MNKPWSFYDAIVLGCGFSVGILLLQLILILLAIVAVFALGVFGYLSYIPMG